MAFVNLYSDTQTRPTAAMRAAIAAAEVGDEQRAADPTTRALEERVAALLGHEAAVFLPSGTMCNEIAIRLHIRPGGERMFIGRDTHTLIAEAGGPAQLSGAVITEVDGDSGMFTAGRARAGDPRLAGPAGATGRASAWCPSSRRRTWAAGACGRSSRCAPCSRSPARAGLSTHLDGARLMNAVVASGVDAADWAGGFDSAWLDFTKGLGAPVGACLAGSAAFIEEAWRWKQMLGGAMRQSGIVAAAGPLRARPPRRAPGRRPRPRQAAGRGARGSCRASSSTRPPWRRNIVIFAVPDAAAFTAALAAEDVADEPLRAHARARRDAPRRRRRGHRPGAGRRGAGARLGVAFPREAQAVGWGRSLAMDASAFIGSRSRARAGASVSSKSSMTIER